MSNDSLEEKKSEDLGHNTAYYLFIYFFLLQFLFGIDKKSGEKARTDFV